ncbi:MAG: RagB/SusD family nutrient uptake outer membrane protein [Bacteroidales bacterium]
MSVFSENNRVDSTGNSVKFRNRDEMLAAYNYMYNLLTKNEGVEGWTADMLIYSDTHADNSYRGATDVELTQLEQQKQDGINKNINRDWDNYFAIVGAANNIICNIDSVPDPTFTLAERKQWKSEALILRAMIYFDIVRLWGDVPVVTVQPPAITNANIESVYSLYYPPRDSVSKVYKQMISDLNTALEPGGAPAIDNTNKFKFSKTVANALLAKIYAEKPVRDYDKVIQYSSEVEKDTKLVANYGDLFEMNSDKTDAKYHNTSESIFEISFKGGGLWYTWLVGIDQSDPSSKYDWAKWCTPSRDLIKAFDDSKDVVRKAQTIVYATVTWSNHYPSNNYPFMYKYRSKFHSVIKLRLADILLLKAEAYLGKNDNASATALVNTIRTRAKLTSLASVTIDDILSERRLELAFEGQRWFDLVRTDKVKSVMNTLNQRDSGRLPMDLVNDNNILMPIPQPQIDKNPSMNQNIGY